jgi:ABC-type nitrate/sulfonate/bicarbonate transport system ATPase subunit
MTDEKRDDQKPKPEPPGTGTGPAGGTPAATPSLPARDRAAEAQALAALESELAHADLPPGEAEKNVDELATTKHVARTRSGEHGPKPEPAITAAKPLAPAPAGKPPVVAFHKVTKTYGTGPGAFTAIKDVSFAIEDHPGRGEFVSILGPSGCGKSTVIRMIAGLVPQFPQSSGAILVDGQPVLGPGPDRGMVFQDYTSFDNRTVLENVAFGLECRGLQRSLTADGAVRKQTSATFTTASPHGFERGDRAVIEGVRDRSFNGKIAVLATPTPTSFTVEQPGPDATSGGGVVRIPSLPRSDRHDRARYWIQKVGLDVKRDGDKYPHQLSGGMRQRVAIARTLILEPRIILMDEPFGALDPPTRSRMQDNLVALWREQSPTVFFITHSIEEAVYLGDHILIFSNSPGTVLKELRVPPPDRPSIVMQRDPKFVETVLGIRETIDRLESSNRAGDA